MKFWNLPVIALTMLISLFPGAALCTDPAGDTFIVKQDSKWTGPLSLWQNLIIIDKDLGTRKELKLRQLFPGKDEYKHNSGWTTAGPRWDGNSVYFIVMLNQKDYFYIHKATTGKRLLINLDSAMLEDPEAFNPQLTDSEKEFIRSTLSTATLGMTEGKGITIRRYGIIEGAMLLAAQMGMKEVRKDLEAIEESDDYDSQRLLAQATLRRLGFSPKGVPLHLPFYVDNEKRRDKVVIPSEQRLNGFARCKNGIPSDTVYRLMGPPDYRQITKKNHKLIAWRYDFGPQPDFSLMLLWDDEGMLAKVEKVSPGLWHDNELFDDAEGRPLYSGNGDVDLERLHSKHFLGKIEVIKIQEWDEPATGPIPPPAPAANNAALPAIENIHGWNSSQVQELQRNTASSIHMDAVFRELPEAPEMVVIPAGTFKMGSPEENPAHLVTISKPFAVGKTEVSYAEWNACVDAGFCLEIDRSWHLDPTSPVPVGWVSAKAYVKWLNSRIKKQTGREGRYRLLSEAEWEYAARAGTTGPYSFEEPISQEKANYGSASYPGGQCLKGCSDCRGKTIAVGSLPANPWGLHEMHGNIPEWVEDCAHRNYTDAPTDGSAWGQENGGACEKRIIRGGSWQSAPQGLRSASRENGEYNSRHQIVGFRLARTLD